MGKWAVVGLLVLLGFSLLDGHTLSGLVMLGIAGLITFLSLRGSGGRSHTYSSPARPGQLSAARYDAREEIADAERRAARAVRQAQVDAESEGHEALRAAMTYMTNEARWV